MTVRVGVFVAAMLLVGSAQAQTEQVRRGPAPDWVTRSELLPVPTTVTGPVFLRRQDVEVHLSAKGQAQYLGYRIKVLDSNALQIGNIAFAWKPGAGAPIVHGITVYRDGQAIDVLKTTAIEVLRREDQLEAAKLDGMLTAVVRVPDLRVGDELEVDMTIFSSDPVLANNESGLLVLGQGPGPGRYHLGLSWEPGREPRLRPTPDMTAAMVKRERAVDFRFDNPPVLSPPKDAPPRYGWQRIVEFSDFADWAAVSRHFAPVFAKAATPAPGSAIKDEARRIAAANPLPLDRAKAALKLVQQNVRYIYVGLNGGNLVPATADETWQRRYGDCKGKTVLLMALLAELGIASEPVLVNSSGNDDGYDQRLPLPQLFDHVLVRATIDGKRYWLDGTLPGVAGPSASPIFPVAWVLPLTTAGNAIEQLPWRPAATPDEINLYEVDARTGFDKPARITATEIIRGVKGLEKQAQFSSVNSAQLLAAFRQNAIGDVWQTIEDVKWRYDEAAGASVLTITGTGAVTWDNDGGGVRSLALAGGGFSPPDRRVRSPDQNQAAPFYAKPEYSCYATTVRLPTTTRPEQWSAKPSFDTRMFGREYYRAWELRDGAVRMIRGSRVEQPEIDPATAQRDNARIAGFDNSMAWITFDPAGKKAAVGKGEKVPATYEIDWTGAAVPCLPAAGATK